MKITARSCHRGVCIAVCAATLFCFLSVNFVTAAQKGGEADKPRKEKDVESATQKRGTVIVEVRIIESEKDKTPQKGAGVAVHLSGVSESRTTDENGQRRFTGIPMGTVDLTVMAPETEKCPALPVAVSEAEQLVVVLVDKSKKNVECTRLKR